MRLVLSAHSLAASWIKWLAWIPQGDDCPFAQRIGSRLVRYEQSAVANCSSQGFVVAFHLVGIADRKSGDCRIECVALTQVAADRCRLTGTSVSPRQRPAAVLREHHHVLRVEPFHFELDL